MPTLPPLFWIGCYLLIGVLVDITVPMGPQAKEAFEMAEKTHPAGRLLRMVLVAMLWPMVIIGRIVRFFC